MYHMLLLNLAMLAAYFYEIYYIKPWEYFLHYGNWELKISQVRN